MNRLGRHRSLLVLLGLGLAFRLILALVIDYQIQKPTGFSVLSIADSSTMELQLFFTHA